MAELLLELFSEEIPARMQGRAAEDLRRLATEKLAAAGLGFDRAEAYVTPRRLTLVVGGLPAAQPDVHEERKGPRVGSPDKAMAGFLKGAGLSSLEQAEKRATDKGEFWFAVIARQGRPTPVVLAELLPEALGALPWPKSMRWASHSLRWVRPLHSILCLFDGAIVPFKFGHLTAGDATRGHRFLGAGAISVRNFDEYRGKLRSAYVMLDAAERRQSILKDAAIAASAKGLTLIEDPGLLEEVGGLVEWPVPLIGDIDPAYMELPPEVLTTSMRTHQKYFALQDAKGGLAPHFVVAANNLAQDGGKQIVAGNERVLSARLADAKFFWDQDRKHKLESRVPALKDIVFHARLGTVADKVVRMGKLAAELAPFVPGADAAACQRAALLAKADLTTGMVGEFPELQGIMGRYYARHDGEGEAVSIAIAEHYSPLGPNDRCPTAPTSVVVALADKLDTLVGFFAIDEKPTGSKDPFALRRAALGVIRLVTENSLRLPLRRLSDDARQALRETMNAARAAKPSKEFVSTGQLAMPVTVKGWGKIDQTILALLDFFADRLKVHLREQGVRHDLVSAVFALGGEDDLVRLLARVHALKDFLASEDGGNLLVAYRRAANILRIEEKRDSRSYGEPADAKLLQQAEEKALFVRLEEVEPLAQAALKQEQFAVAAQALARLRAPVDAFFDKVTVNAEDAALRANRLRLLARIRAELDQLADFSKIEG